MVFETCGDPAGQVGGQGTRVNGRILGAFRQHFERLGLAGSVPGLPATCPPGAPLAAFHELLIPFHTFLGCFSLSLMLLQ